MGKHVSQQKVQLELNDSFVIIVATIACVLLGEYISALIILLLHQVFMFVSYTQCKDTDRLPDSGYRVYRKVSKYVTLGFLALAVIVAGLFPIKSHEWVKCGKIAIILALLSCDFRIFESLDLALHIGSILIEKLDIITNGYDVIEKLGRVKSLILNKTGTLTESDFRIIGIFPSAISERQFISIARAVESQSNHPISIALDAPELDINDIDFQEFKGKGIQANYNGNEILFGNARFLSEHDIKCNTPEIFGLAVHLAVNGNYCGYIVFENKTRPGTFDCIEKIRDSGVENLYLLSCDLQSIVQPISQALGFDVYKAELSQSDKINSTKYIVSNKMEKSEVAYAGNIDEFDVAVTSDISIVFGDSQDADICICNDGIFALPDIFNIAKRVTRIQTINLYISLISRCLVIFLLFLGVCSPIPAAFILILSAIFTFIDNNERFRL